MKNLLLPFLALLSFFTANGQLVLPFEDLQSVVSPCNPTQTIKVPKHWQVYQTVDDLWDSPVDSTHCFPFDSATDGANGDLSAVDIQRPLFLRARFDSLELEPNTVYNFFLAIDNSQLLQYPIDYGTNCSNSVCTGFLAGVEIPDESGSGKVLRWYQMNEGPNNDFGHFSYCFLSEKFGGTLKFLIVKITFNDELPANPVLFLKEGGVVKHEADFLEVPNPIVVNDTYYNGSSYDAPLSSLYNSNGLVYHFLFLYPDSTYPSSQHIGYHDVQISPNKPEPQVINLIAGPGDVVMFQPFTQLRGGLVEGDTLRHEVTLVSNGMSMCLEQVVELVFNDGTNFLYNYGDIHFGNYNACFMFRSGSLLKIGDGATFNYGNYGLGILALFPDSKLQFGENATLVVDGRMMLMGYPEAPENELHIELRPGQKLIFSKQARLMRVPWATAPVHLNVHMLGGELDDSNLRPEDRELIRRIYPEVKGSLKDNLAVSPNPNSGTFEVQITANEPGQAGFQLFTLDGKAVGAPIQKALEKGFNSIPLSWPVARGVYLLRVNTETDVATKKIVVN
ncbi:MAG: hypothetical protein Kow0027_19490 [Saprospiraceae bacterium]